MLALIRGKFGPIAVFGIIGFIAFVFVVQGVFSPKATRGLHEGSVAGMVNGEPITLAEFSRAVQQRMEFFKNLMGGKESPIQEAQVREGVFNELANRKLVSQMALHEGWAPSDAEVKAKIMEIPAFQKDGRFDMTNYKLALQGANYTPDRFEASMREDLAVQRWNKQVADRLKITETELREMFDDQFNKRTLKIVVLSAEQGKHGVKVTAEETKKFLADAPKLNLVKSTFEAERATKYKDKSLESVQDEIARDLIAEGKLEEIKKVNQELAAKVEKMLRADKGSDAALNALLKPYGTEVKNTGMISRSTQVIPGVGMEEDVIQQAFQEKSTMDLRQGGKPQVFEKGTRILVAAVVDGQTADPAAFEKERSKLMTQVRTRKERAIMEGWLEDLKKRSKIEKNVAVVGSGDAG